jgi:hypothetical protein
MRPDSGVLVRVAATNRTARTLHMEMPEVCVVGFEIIAPNDVDLFPQGSRCDGVPQYALPAGGTLVAERLLLPTPRWDPERGVVRWPAGTYRVIGHLRDKHGDVIRRTEPQEFELVCSDPAWTEC